MDIEKGDIGNGEFYIAYDVNNGNDRLAIAEYKSQLRFAIRTESDNRTFTFLSREQIQALLPYLQAFAETGQLEPQDPTLQGKDLFGDIDQLYENTKRENAILAATNEYVRDLKQLVRDWRILHRDTVANPSDQHVWQDCYGVLQEKTSQLLGE